MVKVIEVVGAIILDEHGRILIGRRGSHKNLAGYYEFPGGKIDPNETPEVALEREITEELGVKIIIGDFYQEATYAYDFGIVHLQTYICSKEKSVMINNSTDHDQLLWVKAKELGQYNFAPADIEIIKQLKLHRFDLL